MGISGQIDRLTEYHRRHGFRATIQRAGLAARRALFSGRSVLFYCDMSRLTAPPAELPSFLKIERKRSEAELSPEDLTEMTSSWNPKLARRNIKERFGKGASLWLIRSSGSLAGYGWTIRGSTIEPHYFPLGPDDAHLFDFHVLSQYRGRGINPLLVTRILCILAAESVRRTFIEAAKWNEPQLSSLTRTPFCRLGLARKLTILGRTIVFWSEKEGVSLSKDVPQVVDSHRNRQTTNGPSIVSQAGTVK